jgi:Skp family chaperone for outer membrane proteins
MVGSYLSVQPAYAEIKIGTVDMTKVLQESPKAKAKIMEIDQKAKMAKQNINKKKDEITKLQQTLGNELSTTSPEGEKFRKASKELQRYIRDTEEELKTELVEIRKNITDQAISNVNQIAKSKNLDLVLEKSEAIRGPVLFSAGVIDITDSVLSAMK